MTKKRNIEVGQTIYVNAQTMFLPSKPNLDEYVVTKVNTRSFYAHKKGSDYERRFDKRTWQHESLGELYQAYETEKEYWDLVELAKEKKALRENISRSLPELNIKQLRKIYQIINSK